MRVAVFALLLVAASAYRVRRDTTTDIKTKVETSFKQMGENFDEACTGIFDENAKFIGYDGMVLDGQAAICEKMKTKMEMFKNSNKMTYTVDNLIEEGDIAITFGTISVTVMHNEEEHVKNMKSLIIFKKVDGDLKAIFDGIYKSGGEGHHGHGHGHRVRRAAGSASEKIDALMEKVKGLQAEGKMDEIMNLVYADNIIMYTPKGKVIEGKAAIGEFYKKKLEKWGKPEVEMTRKHLIEEGDLAIVIGEKTMKFQKDGETKEKTITFVTVFKADGDSYKAVAKANFYQKSGNGHEHGPNHTSNEEVSSEEATPPTM